MIMDVKREPQVELATKIYEELKAAGIDAALDDRKLRPGPKFKDLELLGFPINIVVGRGAEEGLVEFGLRTGDGRDELAAGDSLARCQQAISELSKPLQ